MAKVQYSALINRISGRIFGNVFSEHRGTPYLKRHSFSQHQPRSSTIQNNRGLLNTLSGKYYALSSSQKALWGAYASMLRKPSTGFNAFLKLNLSRSSYLPSMAILESPPLSPSTPTFIKNTSIACLSSGYFCFFWTAPSVSSQFVIIHFSLYPGRIDRSSKNWKFGISTTASNLSCGLNLSYPANTLINFRFKTMDLFGRLSPPLFDSDRFFPGSGSYGSNAYGWAYYN